MPLVGSKPDYEPPARYRPFKNLQRIGLDIETYDPGLTENGSGAYRDDGSKIVGVDIAYRENDAVYYPTGHVDKSRCVADPKGFYDWLRAEAAEYEGEIVGANLVYDLDWLSAEQDIVFPKAKLRDVQVAEPLLDENKKRYSLESLCQQYLGEGKHNNNLVYLYGIDYIKNMDRVDPGWASAYADHDTMQPMLIIKEQLRLLEAEGLMELFILESRLTPLLIQMRKVGVRVNVEAAKKAFKYTKKMSKEVAAELEALAGWVVNVDSPKDLPRLFNQLDIPYPITPITPKGGGGNPSFKKDWLEAHDHPVAKMIVKKREYDKIGGTFLKGYIIDGHVLDKNGHARIHANFNQLKSDKGGTVSGRFSSSNPNLQNIPTRHPVLGHVLRSIFIPEDGMEWGSADWSQIEYRFLVHFATLVPAKYGIDPSKAVKMYQDDPKTDFHAIAADLTGVPRKKAKNINFGVVYGMGAGKMARSLGVSEEEGMTILNKFHEEMPFLRGMLEFVKSRVIARGYLTTIFGRKRRFSKWEFNKVLFDTEEEAWEYKRKHPSWKKPQRAKTHAALNALLQGSAADLMKLALVKMYEEGIFEVLVPHITVHDEMNVSIPPTPEGDAAFEKMVYIMENTVKLIVPVFADSSRGANWADAH